MPAITEEKAAKDFMITIKRFSFVLLLPFLLFLSCGEENPEVFVDELPLPDPFQLSLNLDLVSYQSLQFEKNVILPDVGLNGVIVVKRAENDYAAFERTCPYEPEKDCSIVSMNAGQQYLECECGNSFYNLSGYPTNSPSPRKLREYYTSLSGRNLYIDNTIVRSENR
ncbi:hypothetical protein [uncultured Marivirga sp.]|uniref:hypothetical protein n=2 Tax=Marivirga TaxID=869806 RepID=UPI0030EBEBE9